MKRIYLDNAATTLIDKKIAKNMATFETKFFGNPNSIHREGQDARAKIDFARQSIADFFNCKPQEIIFTSGATESNNLAIQGVVSEYVHAHNMKPHVITTQLEHLSVYNTVKELERKGIVEATFIKPDTNGVIKPEQVIKEIKENTVLISMIFISNEIGTILPIREVGKLLVQINQTNKYKILLHTDAVQAVKFYNCNVEKLGVDLLSFSAHKIHGPKGIGGLFVKSGIKIGNLMFGGSQEYDLRPGTQNSPGIIGMAQAYELLGPLEDRQAAAEKIRHTKTYLVEQLSKINSIEFNGTTDTEHSAPDILNFSVWDKDQEMVIAKLDLAGIAVSTGSACVSGSTKPSHVINALGKVSEREAATIRISFDTQNTKEDADYLIKTIKAL